MSLPEIQTLHALVQPIFEIEAFTIGDPERGAPYARYLGKLRHEDSAAAYDQLCQALRPYPQLTPLFRVQEDDRHLILLIADIPQPKPTQPFFNILLFLLTIPSVMFAGALFSGESMPFSASPAAWIGYILSGWQFAFALLGILLAHEFGHYFAARYHNMTVTLPYLIPLPLISPFGTLGAIILLKSIVKNRRALFDVAIAGPLSGLVVALPVLFLGLSLSQTSIILPVEGAFMEGNSLAYLFAKYLVFGEWLPAPDAPSLSYWLTYFFTGQPYPAFATDVYLHPLALAGWFGLFITGLNLLPILQLDGGHLWFVLTGKAKTLHLPLVLLGLGILGIHFPGWFVIIGIAYALIFTGGYQPPLLDEITTISPRRKWLALFGLLLGVFLFTPVPITIYLP
jgi:membrane-associated protease RseP (regulator of RpoE activity)